MKMKVFKKSVLGIILGVMTILAYVPCVNAVDPMIYSITPNMGSSEVATSVTIKGAGFQPTPRVALYGGEAYIAGSCDTPSFAEGVYVAGSYAYVADYSSGLQVIDVSDPQNPAVTGACDTTGDARGVYVVCSFAYVADQ